MKTPYVSLATFRRSECGRTRRWCIGQVFPGGPADAAGLQPGDIIMAVDGESVKSLLTHQRLAELINKPAYTLSIVRASIAMQVAVTTKPYAELISRALRSASRKR